MAKKIKVEVKAEEALEKVRAGEDFTLYIDDDGFYSFGDYGDSILKQDFLAYDYEELEKDDEEYIYWLNDCYADELEASSGDLVKISFK